MNHISTIVKINRTGRGTRLLLPVVSVWLIFVVAGWAGTLPHESGKQKVAELNQLAKKYSEIQPSMALEYAKEAVHQAIENQDRQGQADALLNMGLAYLQIADLPNMRKHLEESLTVAQQIDYLEGMGNAHNFLGTYFSEEGLFDQSLINYTKALKIRTDLGDRIGMSKTINNQGLVYGRNGYPEKGIALLKQAIEMKQSKFSIT